MRVESKPQAVVSVKAKLPPEGIAAVRKMTRQGLPANVTVLEVSGVIGNEPSFFTSTDNPPVSETLADVIVI